ncbi:hypothetical protein O3M35_005361 [Rhynocoris fuscipes]|uniref:Transcription termination factor 2 n=1 Tax=Rhynocoris fuscipes TaxID=488301 RepID=A0AAW1DND1_9HEMI
MANKMFSLQSPGDHLSSDEELNPENVFTEESDDISSDESSYSGACANTKVNTSIPSYNGGDDSAGFSSDDTLDCRNLEDEPQTSSHKSSKRKPSIMEKLDSAEISSDEGPDIYSEDTLNYIDLKDKSQISSKKIHEEETFPESQTSSHTTSKRKPSIMEKILDSAEISSDEGSDIYSEDSVNNADLKDKSQISSKKIHEKETFPVKDKVSKRPEVVDLTNEEKIDLDKIIQDEVTNKESNLKVEKQRLELEARDVIFQLNNIESAIKSMELEKLPDKGVRMKHKMEKKRNELKSIAERQSFIDKQLKAIQKDQKTVPYINELPTASLKLSELGKKALETHNIERALTADTLEKIHKSIENQPKNFTVEPKSGLKINLLPHQKYALGWALWRETQKPCGGILADDMGLGKTLSMISLILHTLEDKHNDKNDSSSDEESSTHRRINKGGTLVITPASVMGQWENEVKSKVKSGKMSCYIYHGPSRKKRSGIHTYDIVLSTYSTILNEYEDDPLMKIRWKRIVLDEAHMIRNAKSKTAQSIFNLKGGKRWALTGTPVQNKELDLYSILRFLHCKPFDNLTIWKKWIDNKDAAGIQRLNCILKAILLRRTKEELKTEGNLESLKTKTVHDISVLLNEKEYEIYKKVAYFSKTLLGQLIHQRAEKEDLLEGGMGSFRSRSKDISDENPFRDHPELRELYRDMMSMGNVKTHHILVLLLRLRQICCHPSLACSVLDTDDLKTDGIESDQRGEIEVIDRLHRMSISNKNEETADNIFHRSTWSSKLRAVVDCVMDILEKTKDKIIVVSQWKSVLDIIKDYLGEKDVDSVEFTGSILVKLRPAIIKEFNENLTGHRVMLLSLMAGGTGLNLIGANHLILIDCHWNPQLEAQACDRIYRVGQPKEVHIYKFVCSSTIEERIVELQKKKLELSEGVLKGSVNATASKLTLNDLKALFQVK